MTYHDEEWGPSGPRRRRPLRNASAWRRSSRPVLDHHPAAPPRLPRRVRRLKIAEVAEFTDTDRERLLADPGIIRNRAKIDATPRQTRAKLAGWAPGRPWTP
ncbi:hypothetical protein GCM10023238_38260 [Streptomyces heliomycini]